MSFIYTYYDKNAIFTVRKRSLGQGNVFTSICHSVHEGGGSASGGEGWADPPPPSDTTGYGQRAGGTHPIGMHSCNLNMILVEGRREKMTYYRIDFSVLCHQSWCVQLVACLCRVGLGHSSGCGYVVPPKP